MYDEIEEDAVITQEERLHACSIYPKLSPGVYGEVVVRSGVTFINYIYALHEGSGQVGEYLDSLSGPVIFEAVLSKRLRGMLERRGYKRYGIGVGWSKGI